jgi:two-component system, chemotaxis family, response regulator Rcp1
VLPAAELVHFWDGDQALAELESAHTEKPSLIFLDITLKKMPAHSVLHSVKANKKLRDVPLIVLTGSASNAVKQEFLSLGANDFCYKPNGVTQYVEMIKQIRNKWVG